MFCFQFGEGKTLWAPNLEHLTLLLHPSTVGSTMPSMQHTSLNTCQILSYDTVLQGIPRASESQTHALLARVLQAVAHHSEFSKARVSEEACEVRCAGHSSVHRCVQQNYLGMTYLQPQHRRKNNSNDNTMLAIEESRKRMKEDERR